MLESLGACAWVLACADCIFVGRKKVDKSHMPEELHKRESPLGRMSDWLPVSFFSSFSSSLQDNRTNDDDDVF